MRLAIQACRRDQGSEAELTRPRASGLLYDSEVPVFGRGSDGAPIGQHQGRISSKHFTPNPLRGGSSNVDHSLGLAPAEVDAKAKMVEGGDRYFGDAGSHSLKRTGIGEISKYSQIVGPPDGYDIRRSAYVCASTDVAEAFGRASTLDVAKGNGEQSSKQYVS